MTVRVTREAEPQIEIYGAYSGELLGSGNGVRATLTFTPTDDYVILVVKGDMDMVQLEAGSFPTSYIPTSGATATRAADIASIPVSDFGYNQKAGTVVVEFASVSPIGARTNDGVFSLEVDNDDLHRVYIPVIDALNWQMRVGGSTIFASALESGIANGQDYQVATTWSSGSQSASVDGQAAVSFGTSATLPSAATRMKIGYINSADFLNGHIKSIQYYPRRLTNTQLQTLTS